MELPEKRGKQLAVIPNFSKISLKILFIEITFDDIAKRCDKEIQSVPSLCNLIHTLPGCGATLSEWQEKGWKTLNQFILSRNNQPSVSVTTLEGFFWNILNINMELFLLEAIQWPLPLTSLHLNSLTNHFSRNHQVSSNCYTLTKATIKGFAAI